jgi:hypothetical protein
MEVGPDFGTNKGGTAGSLSSLEGMGGFLIAYIK